ncbi:MAG: PIN domain-containing protein [Candidatus Bathyarchaeia archaeon]
MRRRGLRESLEKYVVDAGVLVEYVVRSSPHRGAVEKMLDGALANVVELYITPITVSEIIYVASRIYELAGVENPNEEALNLVEWLTVRVEIVKITPDMTVEAGEIKKKLGVSLSGCYVIAAAINLKAKALFLKPEKEMLSKMEELRKLPITFLTETSSR